MQIVAKADLVRLFTESRSQAGPFMDPENEFREEMTAFAAAITADLPEEVTHIVITDHENADDVEVSWPDYAQLEVNELIPMTYSKAGDYYGVTERHKPGDYTIGRRIYNLYWGGSPINSAPGIVLTTAVMAPVG